MSKNIVLPANQEKRIRVLRFLGLLIIPMALLTHPVLGGYTGEILEQIGMILIVVGVIGRFWATLYIGGHKNKDVITDGPYSICRHPLYLFSSIAVLGFGIMLQSLLFALIMALAVFMILTRTAAKEEAHLRFKFGDAYDAYARQTPRIFPNLRLFRTEQEVTFSVAALRKNFFDAVMFIALIPIAESIEEYREQAQSFFFWLL